MSLDEYIPEEPVDPNLCQLCKDPICGTCKYCKKKIVCGFTCVSCARSGDELEGWYYKGINHGYKMNA